jgi:hypothetical protein
MAMRRYRIWLGVALVSSIFGAATAQDAVECKGCQSSVTITSESWPCVKKWVDASESAATDPIKFPVSSNGDCSSSLASRPFKYAAEVSEPFDGSWMSLRLSEAQCLSGLGPKIDQKFSGGAKSSVTVSLKGCKIQE